MGKLACLVIFAFSGIATNAQNLPSTCPVHIGLVGNDVTMPVQLRDVQSVPHSVYSEVTVRAENHDARPVNSIFVVIEFSRGPRFLESAVFYATTLSDSPEHRAGVKFSGAFVAPDTLYQSLMPSHNLLLQENVPTLSPECPDKA